MRANLILVAVAILLAPLTWFTFERESASFTDYSEIPRLFPGLRTDRIQQVLISEPTPIPAAGAEGEAPEPVQLLLQRSDEGWVVGNTELAGVAARASEVQRAVLRHLAAIRRDERALIDPDADEERLLEYGLSETQAMRVRAYDAVQGSDGQPVLVADLLLGKAANAGGREGEEKARGYYVRRADDDAVVFYEADAWFLSTDPQRFVDPRLMRFDLSRAVRLDLRNRYGLMSLERSAGTGSWTVAEGEDGRPLAPEDVGAVRQPLVTEILGQMAQLSAARFLEQGTKELRIKYGLSRPEGQAPRTDAPPIPQVVARVRLEDGTDYSVFIGDKVATVGEYYAMTSTTPFLVTVQDFVFDALRRDVKAFFDPAPSGGPPAGGTAVGGSSADAEKKDGRETKDGSGTDGKNGTDGKTGGGDGSGSGRDGR